MSAVFKWGSLVGIEMPSLAADGTLFRGAADVVFRPAGFTGTITDDWTTVPWCNTDFGDYDTTATDHLSRVNDPTAGLGDICRYMGVVDSANWRIPTAAEWDELYREQNNAGESAVLPSDGSGWILGSFHPLSGAAMGSHRNNIRITSNTQVDNADPYDDGAVFLPASGFRHPDYNGTIFWIGLYGLYWSSTASTSDHSNYMSFSSTNVWPQQSGLRAYAFGVRCIRE